MLHYLTSEDDKENPRASPLLGKNLSGLPPCLIISGDCDPLVDESVGMQLIFSAVTGHRLSLFCYKSMGKNWQRPEHRFNALWKKDYLMDTLAT